MAYSILTPEQIQVVTAAVGDVTNAVPLAAGPVSNVVSPTVSAVPSGLDVATVSNAVVESAGVVVLGASKAAAQESGLSFWAIVGSLFCCGGTFGLCKVRAGIVAAVREFDPDNALHLNSLLTLFEEGSWLAILPVLLVFPVLALLLMLVLAVFGWALSRPLKKIAEKRRAYWDAMGKDGMKKLMMAVAGAVLAFGAVGEGRQLHDCR